MREGWTRVALGDICEIRKGQHPLEKTAPGQYPLVGTAAEWRTSATFDFVGQAVCIPMVSSTGHGHASLKRVHFVEGEFAVANIVAAAVTKDPRVVDGRYLHAYLQTYRDRLLVTLMQGTANVSLKIADLVNVPVDLPPLDEQRRIVDLIGSLDATITATDQAVAKAEQARRAVLTDLLAPPSVVAQATTARGSSTPAMREGWSRVALGDVIAVNPKSPPLAVDAPFITMDAVPVGGRFPAYSEARGSRSGARAAGGDTLLARITPCLENGKVAQIPAAWPACGGSTELITLRATDAVIPDFVFLLATSHSFRRGAEALMTGTTGRQRVSASDIASVDIDLPPLDEQRRIVDIISTLDDEVAALKSTARTARTMRVGLLSELLSGNHEIPSTYDRLLEAA